MAATLGEGAAWGALAALLATGGHAPTGPLLLPLDAGAYYAAQALFAVPLVAGANAAQALAANATARALGGRGDLPGTFHATALGASVPTIAIWIAADAAAYLLAGFDALAPTTLVAAPLTLVSAWAACARGLRSRHGLTRARGAMAAAAGLLARGLVLAPLLR